MTIDDTFSDQASPADEPAACAAADGAPETVSDSSSDPGPRSHWDRVLAAVQERA